MSVGELTKAIEYLQLAKIKTSSAFIQNEIKLVESQLKLYATNGVITRGALVLQGGLMGYRLAFDPKYTRQEFLYDGVTTRLTIGIATKTGSIIGSYFGPGYGTAIGAGVGLGVGIFFNYIKPSFK